MYQVQVHIRRIQVPKRGIEARFHIIRVMGVAPDLRRQEYLIPGNAAALNAFADLDLRVVPYQCQRRSGGDFSSVSLTLLRCRCGEIPSAEPCRPPPLARRRPGMCRSRWPGSLRRCSRCGLSCCSLKSFGTYQRQRMSGGGLCGVVACIGHRSSEGALRLGTAFRQPIRARRTGRGVKAAPLDSRTFDVLYSCVSHAVQQPRLCGMDSYRA